MAEIPVGYFPDVPIAFPIDAQLVTEHETEILRARNRREQRRGVILTAGQRMWAAHSSSLEQPDRLKVQTFLNARRGSLDAFYFFPRAAAKYEDVACGSASAQTFFIPPFKDSTITDVRVAGLTKAFTVRKLTPRTGTYTTLRFYQTASNFQSIDCGSNAAFKITGDLTMAAWIYTTDATLGQFIMGNETANASGFVFAVASGGSRLSFRTNQAGANTSAQSNASSISGGGWIHVAAVKSGTTITFYVNGVAAGSASVTNPVAATANFRLSANSAANFDGMMSDARFYDVALSAGEITNIYNGNATPSANLRGWWRLEEGTGTSTVDWSGYGNTGTIANLATLPAFGAAWVAGEDEVKFTGGNQTGAVTAWLTGRERLIARSLNDKIAQTFMQNAADVRAIYDIAILELPF
jgi:hypothetical protein